MHAYPIGLSFGSKATTFGRAVVIYLIVALTLVTDLYLSSPVFAESVKSICIDRIRDPAINADAQVLIILLLDGQPSFYAKYNAELAKFRAGPTPQKDQGELALDMHCMDPQDVKVGALGGKFAYSIDGWRIKVNEAIGSLAYSKKEEIQETLARVEKDVNGIPDYDHPLFVADFNRTAKQTSQPYFARLRPDGSIEIIRTQ